MRAFPKLAALALASAALAGCGPDYDHTEIVGIVPSRLGGRIDYTRVEVPVGMVVKAHIAPYNDERELMPTSVRSLDPSVMEVSSVITDQDFAFLGLRPGVTQIELRAEGELVLVLDAVVTEQPAAP